MPRPRIGLITPWDARTPGAASGIPYYMARALQRHVGDVAFLGPAHSWHESWSKVRNRVGRMVTGRGRPYVHGLAAAREYAAIFAKRLKGIDWAFAPLSSTQIALLDTSLPLVYTSDTTWNLLQGYYPEYSALDQHYVAEAEEIERRAIGRARLIPYPSRWAAESAVRSYGAAPERVSVIPWGANIEIAPALGDIEPAKPLDRCELVFLGRDWERKGGPLAYATVLALREGGLDATLSVCGCTPPQPFDSRALRIVPRIDKADPAQARALQRLLLGASFMLQPTRFESLGLAYAEASAHGTPSIATDTGGVSGVITNGENGFLLPVAAGAAAYAEVILKVFSDRPRYLELVASSRRSYDTRLNWDTWARSMAALVAGLQ